MNETIMPPRTTTGAAPGPCPLGWWMRQALVLNPCYPVSAILLLFGAFSVSKDPALRGHDLARLGFNSGALQFCEVLLVVAAVFLALAGLSALVWIGFSRRPALAFVGAVIAAGGTAALFPVRPECVHLAAQAGLVCFLSLSLRWEIPGDRSAGLARSLALLTWICHAWFWVAVAGGNAGWMVACFALVACAFYGIHLRFGGTRWPWFPGAGCLILLSGPGCLMARELASVPTGVLATLAGFGLFGLGTLLALTRLAWHATARR